MSVLPREERLLNLLSALLAARGPVPFSEILGTVAGYDDPAGPEALDKRFDRDKADLRSLGVPLQFVAGDEYGRSGYRILRERFFLEEIHFTIEEGIVLAALQRGASAAGQGPVEASLRSALAKVGVDSPLSGAFRESVAEQQLLDPRIRPGAADAPGSLGVLAEALAARRPVRFTYYSLSAGTTGERTVEPYGIGFFKGGWYLVGRDIEKRAERVFRTSRIRGRVEMLPAFGYAIPEGFNLRERVGVAPWEVKNGPRVTARVRFLPEVSWMIRENLRPGQSFLDEPDGSGVLEVEVTDADALVRWVAGYGPLAELLEPKELRERMRRHFEELLAEEET